MRMNQNKTHLGNPAFHRSYYPFLSTPQCICIWAPGAFAFAAGKQGGGQGKSLLQNVFGLDLAVDFHSLRKSFFVHTITVYWFVR